MRVPRQPSAGVRPRTHAWAAVAACALAGALAPSAQAATDADVQALRSEPCPPEYRIGGFNETNSQHQVEQARENSRFKIAGRFVKLEPPIDWRANPVGSKTYRNALFAMNWTKVLFQAYHAGDQGALRQARLLFLDFVKNQQKKDPGTLNAAWGTKRVGDRGALMSYVTRASACDDELSDARAKRFIDSLVVHGRTIVNNRTNHNHGLFDALGLGIIAVQLPFLDQADRWREVARERFEEILRRRVIEQEGFWLEHTSSYHLEVTNLLGRFLDLPGVSDAALQQLLGRMEEVGGWLVEPDRHVVQWGDANLWEPAEEVQQEASGQSGLFALPRSGLAFVKQAGSYLGTMTSFHNTTHKHSDELTIDLFEDGHRVLQDTGLYHKDRGRWFEFTRSARAHSTLTVDGETFGRSNRWIYRSGIVATGQGPAIGGGHWYAIESTNPILAERTDANVRRWLVYRPGVALFVVDRVRARSRHVYERFFHLGPDLDIAAGTGFLGLSATNPAFAGRLRNGGTAPASRRTLRAERDPLQGWTSPNFREKEARWVVSYRGAGTDEDYVTSIGLDTAVDLRATLDGKVTESRLGLDLQGAGPSTHLELTESGGSINIQETP